MDTHAYIVVTVNSGIVITIKSYCGTCFFPFPLHVHTECKYLQEKRARCKYTVGKTSLFLCCQCFFVKLSEG